MSHPYQSLREKKPGKARVGKLYGRYARGGNAKDVAQDASMIKKAIGDHDKQLHGGKHTDLSNIGPKSKGRMDRYARGGKVKNGKTNINIIVTPGKGADNALPPPPPPMAGPPPGPPMPPKPPMGPMGGGMPPGAGMMKRGGKVMSGLSTPGNLKKWADRAGSNTRYASGGKVGMKSGADSGPGRLEKAKAYSRKSRKK